MTPDEARSFFEASRVGRLATADTTAVPHLVPITFAVDGDVIVTAVDGKPKRGTALRRLANIATNPAVSVLVDRYDEDWTQLWWARADGHARILEAGNEIEEALAQLRQRYPQYQAVSLGGPVIVIRVDRWSGWTAAGAETPSSEQPGDSYGG